MNRHFHHRFRRFPFCVRWVLEEKLPDGPRVIARGWSRTKDEAWEASTAALLPMERSLEELEELRAAVKALYAEK